MPPKKKTSKSELIEIVVSFNGMYAGDTANVIIDERVQGWINAGLAKVVDSGADQAGPGAVVADDPGSLTVGAGDGSAPGDEPSEGFGSGGYGAFEG